MPAQLVYPPNLFKLWFCSGINLGSIIRISFKMVVDKARVAVEGDAAIAVAGLYKLLESSYYMDTHRRRKRINNDTGKLMYAEGIRQYQMALLADGGSNACFLWGPGGTDQIWPHRFSGIHCLWQRHLHDRVPWRTASLFSSSFEQAFCVGFLCRGLGARRRASLGRWRRSFSGSRSLTRTQCACIWV